jgi:hypothetical protein
MTLKIAEQTPIRHLEIHLENYAEAMTSVPFLRYLLNTLLVTFWAWLVCLSPARWSPMVFRASRTLAQLVLSCCSAQSLPRQVTLIPVYVFFQRLGWVDTLLPLIVPAFFANAYDVFLLRCSSSRPSRWRWTTRQDRRRVAVADALACAHTAGDAGDRHCRYLSLSLRLNDFYEPLIFLHSRTTDDGGGFADLQRALLSQHTPDHGGQRGDGDPPVLLFLCAAPVHSRRGHFWGEG